MAREQRTRSRPGTAARTAGAAGTAVTGRAPVLLGQGLDSLGRRHHSAPWCSAARSQPGPSPGNEGPWAGRGPTPSRSSSPVLAPSWCSQARPWRPSRRSWQATSSWRSQHRGDAEPLPSRRPGRAGSADESDRHVVPVISLGAISGPALLDPAATLTAPMGLMWVTDPVEQSEPGGLQGQIFGTGRRHVTSRT